VLDTIFMITHAKLSRSAFDEHIRLVFDTFRRLLAVESPSSSSGPKKLGRARRA
jgi:hypothetical protein